MFHLLNQRSSWTLNRIIIIKELYLIFFDRYTMVLINYFFIISIITEYLVITVLDITTIIVGKPKLWSFLDDWANALTLFLTVWYRRWHSTIISVEIYGMMEISSPIIFNVLIINHSKLFILGQLIIVFFTNHDNSFMILIKSIREFNLFHDFSIYFSFDE